MQRYISIVIPFAAFICYCLLLTIVYWQGAKKRVNRVFMLYLLSAAIWSLGSFMWRLQAPLFWNRVLITGATGVSITFFHFVWVFLGIKRQKRWLYLGYGLFAVILIANLLGYVTREAYYVDGVVHYEIGPAAPFMGIFGFFYFGLAAYYLVQQYLRTRDRVYRNRIQYPLLGISLILLAVPTNFVPEIGKYPIDIAASVVNALLIAYAILRHRLLDITFVIRRGLTYSVLTAGIAATYLLTIFVFERLARTVFGYGAYLIPILVAVVIAVAFQPLRGRAQTWVDRLFFREKYDAQQMLHRLSRTTVSILDLNVLGEMLLEEVTTTMHVAGACILLKGQKRGEFYLATQRGLDKDVTDLRLRREHPLLRWMVRERKVLTAHEIDILPQFKALWGEEKETLKRLSAELFVPLLVEGDLVGLFVFGPKLSEEAYSNEDKTTLTTLANQTAMAIGNASLHKAVQQELAERKRTEETLAEERNLLRTLIDNLPDYIYVKDTDSQFVVGNITVGHGVGVTTPDEIVGKTDFDFYPQELAARYYADEQEIIRSGQPLINREEPLIDFSTGDRKWLLTTKVPLRDSEGKIAGLVGIGHDITERKALEEMWRRYDFIVNTSREFMTLTNRDYTYQAVNESYCRAHNKTREEVIGRTVADIWGEERFNTAIKAHLDKCFAGNEVHYQDWFEFANLGQRYFDVTYYPYYSNSRGTVTHAVVVSRDITEYKQAEEEKEKMQAQLLQSQKMEAVGRLAGGVAHDFNNLMTVIIGYSKFLLLYLDEGDALRQSIEKIAKAGQRATSLTRQLLAFSRRQPLQPKVLNLNIVITDMDDMLRRLIGEDIDLVIALEPELRRVKADPGQIEQVIMNLVVNARDAMPQGGRLTIKTEDVTLDEDYCRVIPEAWPGKFVHLSVGDTGVGMDKETLQHIFEPFFTTKEAGKGTGLGLAVVYGIIRQHEGWISVSSEPGQGSTFKVYLPAVSADLEDTAEETMSLQELQGHGERILVVEDDEEVREAITTMLRENDYILFEAAGAEEALDIFEREKGNFHLVFSDVVLPGKTGLQLVDELLSRKSELRVLLGSGYTDQKSQWALIRERGFRFLQKPYTPGELLRAIREAIEQVRG
jgi:two-component system cell cycle sensor histidine kinase/response regulator CckA